MNRGTINDVARLVGSGITPLRSNKAYWDIPRYPWLKTEQLGEFEIFDANEYISQTALEETNIKLWPPKTISVAMYGEGQTRGNASIIMREMATNQACCNIIVDENKADYRFVYYWLKNNYLQLRNLASGVRKNLNSDDIKNFPIEYPDLPIQKCIADVLFCLDKKISINKRINAELEAMAKTLYDYWFVQFDFPDENDNPYRSSGGAMEWNEQLKGEIPKGWHVGRLKDIITIAGEPTIPGEHLKGKFYTPIDELPKKSMSFYGGLPYNEANSSLQLYEKNNLLLGAMRVYFHRVCISAQNGITRSTTIVLKPRNERHLPFAFEVLNMDSTIQYATKVSVGTQQPYVNWEGSLDSHSIVLPPDDQMIDYYSEKVRPIISAIQRNVRENYELTALRDWLLPMLMNGQATVK
jgi:type I restriction enzyme S subunit